MIETLGNLGDFIGGIGVIVTVIYLAVQVRRNTQSNLTSSYQSIVTAISDWTTTVASDKELTRVIRIGMADLNSLDGDEQAQFNLLIVGVLRHYENIHFQYENGFIPADTWEGWASRIKGTVEAPGGKHVWDSQRTAFSNSFRNFIEDPTTVQTTTPGAFDLVGGEDDA